VKQLLISCAAELIRLRTTNHQLLEAISVALQDQHVAVPKVPVANEPARRDEVHQGVAFLIDPR
jgi:hypothetical protein